MDSVYMWVTGKPAHGALEKHNNNLGVMMQERYLGGMRSNGEAERQERCQLKGATETRGHTASRAADQHSPVGLAADHF